MNTKFLLLLAGVALCGASTVTFAQGPDEHGRARGGRRDRVALAQRHPRVRELLRERFTHRREFSRGRIAERLGVTDVQREQLRSQSETVRPIAEQFRAEARAILQRARDAGRDAATREQTRSDLKALFERYQAQLEPNARSLVDSLTPEQRAKLEQHAQRRGRTLDDERVKRAASMLLLRRSRADSPSAR